MQHNRSYNQKDGKMSNYIASLSDTSIDKLKQLAAVPGKVEPIKPVDGYYTIILSPPVAARLNGNKKKFRELNWWKAHWMLQKKIDN